MSEQSGSRGAPTHVELLTVARALRSAVTDDDTKQVHALICRLRADLRTHLHSERHHFSGARDSLGVVVLDGQKRLIDLLDESMLGTGNDSTDCACLVHAVEIEVALRRQAKLEATVSLRSGMHEAEPF